MKVGFVKTNDYLLQLGKLVANLHSLEFALRAFLVKYNEDHEPNFDHAAILPGRHVPENSFTNYDSLGTLLKKFNKIVEQHASAYSIDFAVVVVRDMIAHGRIASKSPNLVPMELVKFGKRVSAGVPVEAMVTMDIDWLRSKVSLVHNQILKVVGASIEMGQEIVE